MKAVVIVCEYRCGMPRSTATALVVVLAVLGTGLSFLALDGDTTSTVENLVADILAASLLTIAVRYWIVTRSRRRFASEYRHHFDLFFMTLGWQLQYFREAATWAARRVSTRVAPSDVHSKVFDLILDPSKPRVLPDLELFQSHADSLARDYGVLDISKFLNNLQKMRSEVAARLDEADAALQVARDSRGFVPAHIDVESAEREKRIDRVNAALRLAQEAALDATRWLTQAMTGLDELYSPSTMARRRHPDPFARWLTYLAASLSLCSICALIAAYLSPGQFPQGFADNTWNNVACAGIAASIAGIVGVTERYSTGQRLLRAAAQPALQLMHMTQAISQSAGHRPEDERIAILRSASGIIRDRANRLQHVRADARLDRYTDELLREIEAARLRTADDELLHLSDDQLMQTGLAALAAAGIPLHNPAGARLVSAANRLHGRVYEMFFEPLK